MSTYYAVGQGGPDARAFRNLLLPNRRLARVLDQALHENSLAAAGNKYCELSRKSGKQLGKERRATMSQEAGQQREPSAPPFDLVFPRLVNETGRPQEKIIGLLAYGLYEQAKREWISDFFSRAASLSRSSAS